MELPKLLKILCPTDFSSFSGRALDHAIALARLYGAEIEVFHVFPVVMPVAGDLTYTATLVRLDEDNRKRLTKDLDQFAQPARDAGIRTTVLLSEGDPLNAILDRARGVSADVIVMGTHGLRGFDRLILGSIAQRVLRKATCPVLTVPPGSDEDPGVPPALKRILCPLDMTEHSPATLAYAVSVARASNASLAVLHVMEGASHRHDALPPPSASDLPFLMDLQHYVDARGRGVNESPVPGEVDGVSGIERIVVEGRAHEVVLKMAAELRMDLIVIGVHGRRGLGLPFFGSTAQHVVQGASCPVLTVRPR